MLPALMLPALLLPPLLNHLWQSTLFLAGIAALALLLRRNGAHLRYWLWLAASAKFLVPFAPLIALGSLLTVQVSSPAGAAPVIHHIAERIAVPFPGSTALFDSTAPVGSTAISGSAPPSAAALAVRSIPSLAASFGGAPHVAVLLFALWALGAAFVSVRWLLRWKRVCTACRTATALPIEAPVPVKAIRSSLEPGLVGIRHPVILIPEALVSALSRPELDAIVAHELCHSRRRDNLTALIQMAAEALLWFYPPVWWLGSRLVAERERACDEAVLATGNDAEIYAESILKVCRFHVRSPLLCAAGVSGADLSARIEAIMHGGNTIPLTVARKWLLTAAGTAALALPALSGMLVIPAASAAASAATSTTPTSSSSIPPTTASAQAEIARRRYEQARPRTAVPYEPSNFDKYAGYYELAPGHFIHLWRKGDRYWTQLSPQEPVEIFPDSQTEFFAKIVPAQITFETSPSGRVTGIVLHQGGLLIPARRVSATLAKASEAALEQRIKRGTASPGTERALRKFIASMQRGHPDYGDLSANLAAAVSAQEPITTPLFQKVGPLVSLAFKGVGVGGADIYDATFAHGKLQFRIAPLTAAGKIDGLHVGPVP